MSKIGKKIINSITDFKNSLLRPRYSGIELLEALGPLPQYQVEYNSCNPNWKSPKMTRQDYILNCKQENAEIRKEYGPVLITYIRKPQQLVLPRYKMTNDELIRYYRENFQNTPIGCVVVLRIDGEFHYGWSLCNKKDRFNKVISLNRALNRAINGDGGFTEYENCPPLVADYLNTLSRRANKYFNKSTIV